MEPKSRFDISQIRKRTLIWIRYQFVASFQLKKTYGRFWTYRAAGLPNLSSMELLEARLMGLSPIRYSLTLTLMNIRMIISKIMAQMTKG